MLSLRQLTRIGLSPKPTPILRNLNHNIIRPRSNLIQALDDPETSRKAFQKLKVIGRNYKGYLKYAVGTGSILGTGFATAHMLDIKEERKLSHKEMMGFPILGAIGGGFIGATAPVWIIFAPLSYIFGTENVAAIAKLILAGVLLSDDGE